MSAKLFFSLLMLCAVGFVTHFSNAEVNPANTVAIWLCDEGAGKTVSDSSGNGHDGTFVNNEGWTSDGKFGSALEFSGEAGNYVEIPHDDSLSLTEWTITAWTKLTPPTTGGWSVVLVKDPANGIQNYSLDMNGDGRVFAEVTSGGGWSDAGSTTTVYDDQWHFLAASYDGTTLRAYVDGVLENEQPFGPGDASDAPVAIGDRLDKSQPIKGTVDEVGLFSVALSEDDLNTVMETGLGSGPTAVEPTSKLAATWGQIKAY
ncbi:LamG domain-containing protein [Candidatus Poribacteria bacterium]|nr:LamG domain-containing protein [Candidatus Poribacteria bacterium]